MRGRIPDETLQAIRDRVSLVEVVSTYVQLKKSGHSYLGLCPFHSEKTPSFNVSEERGLFHCYGCGAGGTVFHFVMRMERLEFPEAVAQLARRAGIQLPERDGDDPAAALREKLYELNAHAARFFQNALAANAGSEARAYLAARGVKAETIERYGLGLAPPGGGALARWIAQQHLPRDLALRLGLLGEREDGTVYDRFRGRVMFPIRDRRGRVIAFGGRTLGSDPPKYLNSPESPLFRKGEGLYGIAEARAAIREHARVLLVEGYMDALLLVQEGIPYAAAMLGTALTAAQLRLLRPFGGNDLTVFFFFDGDRAGRAAAARAFAVCAEADVWGKAVFLPDGFDPDSYVRAHGAAATTALIDAATPLLDHYLDSICPPGAPLPERARAAEDAARVLARVHSDVRFELLLAQAAARLGVSEELFRRARKTGAASVPTPAPPSATPAQWPRAEILLVESMAASREVAQWVAERGVLSLFAAAPLASAGQQIVETWLDRGSVAPVIDSVPDVLAQRLTAALLDGGPITAAERMQVAADCAARIEQEYEKRRRRAIAAELRSAEDRGDEEQLQSKLAGLNALLRREAGKEVPRGG